MLAKTGLLIVSNPKHISKLLTDVKKKVERTLYVQLLSALNEPFGSYYSNAFTSPPKLGKTIYSIYSQATQHCDNLDVRILLSTLKNNVPKIQTLNPIDIVIFDKKYTQNEVNDFIKSKVSNVSTKHDIWTVDCELNQDIVTEVDERDSNVYKHVCLGGTFDRIHSAHKLLLSEAILRASDQVTIGITEECMIHSKILWELIEDVDVRIANVTNFVTDICSELTYNICMISDPFGPAIVEPSMDMIVVSEETIRGGEKINEIRITKGLSALQIIPIPLIDEPNPQMREEKKVSSSNGRLRLLGTLIRPLEKKNIPDTPYVIGLTGGIASGKSGVATHLQNLGVPIIDCDKLGHKMYGKNGPCYKEVIDHFGPSVVNAEGEIDRKVLGGLVFNNPAELEKLNGIMWPAMAVEVQNMIKMLKSDVVCVDAAILCKAGWDRFCHEVWSTFVPPQEAIQRLKTRNNLTEEQAKARLANQPSNKDYIKQANVVFSPLWEVEYTKIQVHRAWDLLKARISHVNLE